MANGGPLGGLFAQGMPKLRPTGQTLVTKEKSFNEGVQNASQNLKPSWKPPNSSFSSSSPSANTIASNSTQQSISSLKTSLEARFGQQNSSFLHTKNLGDNGPITNKNKYHTINVTKVQRDRSNMFPNEMTKGQAPPVPNGKGPALPNKPPSVQRSNSQNTKIGARSRPPGPPSTKPPPPPKSSILTNGLNANNGCQPPSLPSKPPNVTSVNRRASSGATDSVQARSEWLAKTLNVNNTPTSITTNNNENRPPAPPRNESNSSFLNGYMQQTAPSGPPPPPPVSSMPSRSNSSATRTVHKTAPGIPNQMRSQSRPPMGPPPPPPLSNNQHMNGNSNPPLAPHRTTSTANSNPSSFSSNRNVNGSGLYPNKGPPPPSQTKVMPPLPPMAIKNGPPTISVAPLPPKRNTSISKGKNTNLLADIQ